MIRTIAAGATFALLYSVAIRAYTHLRARRDSHRFHVPAVALAATVGGLAFYLAQQIRKPQVPTWLDLPAFLILAVAGGTLPAILEAVHVLRARLLRRSTLRVPPTPEATPPAKNGR